MQAVSTSSTVQPFFDVKFLIGYTTPTKKNYKSREVLPNCFNTWLKYYMRSIMSRNRSFKILTQIS